MIENDYYALLDNSHQPNLESELQVNGPVITTRRATIRDVAHAAGISVATASRVLSQSSYPIGKGTREKVLAAARELNYSPNLLGRMLKKSDSTDIGVIIPNISNPFYPQLVLGIETEARKRGFSILLCNSFRDVAYERKYVELMHQKQIRGIILSSISEEHGFLKDLCARGLKVVAFDQNIEDFHCDKISFDFTAGAVTAVDHLVAMGHRRIAFASSPLVRRSRREIFAGYKLGLAKHNLPFSADFVHILKIEKEVGNGSFEFDSGKNMVEMILASNELPTAVFAVNDVTALGIIHGLMDRKVRVPDDMSVIGFDNIEFSSMFNPPLTTINQPAFETGRLACKVLIETLTEDKTDFVSLKLEPSLVVRSSVRNLRI